MLAGFRPIQVAVVPTKFNDGDVVRLQRLTLHPRQALLRGVAHHGIVFHFDAGIAAQPQNAVVAANYIAPARLVVDDSLGDRIAPNAHSGHLQDAHLTSSGFDN